MDRKILIYLIIFLSINLSACKAASTEIPVTDEKSSIYYVASTGNDSNSGTLNEPFKSINTAISKVVPGDTVIVRGGKYSNQLIVFQ
jgi:hypothetical protein